MKIQLTVETCLVVKIGCYITPLEHYSYINKTLSVLCELSCWAWGAQNRSLYSREEPLTTTIQTLSIIKFAHITLAYVDIGHFTTGPNK